MKKELQYFLVDNHYYGGWQEWFPGYMMRIGGCAAVTACDCSIYFELYKNIKGLYPFDNQHVTRNDYIKFSDIMEPYLYPRWSGIDKLEIYIDGFGKFLTDRGKTKLNLLPWSGDKNLYETQLIIKNQIDSGFPIPFLMLKNQHSYLKDYVWHWFLLTGYDESGDFKVKVVTYGSWRWLKLSDLWLTGYDNKGGLILFQNNQ